MSINVFKNQGTHTVAVWSCCYGHTAVQPSQSTFSPFASSQRSLPYLETLKSHFLLESFSAMPSNISVSHYLPLIQYEGQWESSFNKSSDPSLSRYESRSFHSSMTNGSTVSTSRPILCSASISTAKLGFAGLQGNSGIHFRSKTCQSRILQRCTRRRASSTVRWLRTRSGRRNGRNLSIRKPNVRFYQQS